MEYTLAYALGMPYAYSVGLYPTAVSSEGDISVRGG